MTGQKRKPVDDGTFLAEPGFGGSTGIRFENNVLYGNFQDIPEEWKKMIEDPKLVAPGKGVDGYKLQPGSPLTGAGLPVQNNGGRDYWGNKLPEGGKPSIGAHEAR